MQILSLIYLPDIFTLNVCRDNVLAELNDLPQSFDNSIDQGNSSDKNEEGLVEQPDDKYPVGDAMQKLEQSASDFKDIYIYDFQSWVDRAPKVKTNVELEDSAKKLYNILSNMSEKANSVNAIRSSVHDITTTIRELDVSSTKMAKN